ncbi:MAG TPA: SDR family oxidoreductase [Polyangiaceae bacterium]|jgi:NAD(P)-dependent dehydrogenase (short-subunit alcohol dehydrogenase family)
MTQNSQTKVAFITGGNRGIGLETARELGKLGVTVVIGARDAESGKRALGQLKESGVDAELVRYDAGDPEADREVFNYFERKYGRLDVLVNNAGVLKDGGLGTKNASSVSNEILRDTFEVNFFAVVRLTQTLLPLLKKADAGRIVNLSSILGSLTVHSAPSSPIASAKPFAYNASKTALNAFTVHLADELKGTNVKVNSAHPGWVKTELGGPGAPMELADSPKTSVRLATLGADGPTGKFFHVDDELPW